MAQAVEQLALEAQSSEFKPSTAGKKRKLKVLFWPTILELSVHD
jgi:hypothetical protein